MNHLYPMIPSFRSSPDGDPAAAAAEAPAAGAEAKPATGGVDHAAEVVRLKAELEKVKTDKAELEDVWGSTQKVLLQGTTADTEADLRKMLTRAGFSGPEVERELANIKGNPSSEGTQPQPKPKKGAAATGEEEEVNPQSQVLAAMEQRLKVMEGENLSAKAQQLQRRLDDSVATHLESNTDLKAILAHVKKERPDDHKNLVRLIQGEVEAEAKAQLSRYKQATGRLDPEKFDHYTQEATKTVANKYRSVIGNPQYLGRSSETDSGEQQFLASPPVKLSSKPNGKDGRAEVTAYVADQLTRSLMGQDNAESRV